MKKTGAPPKKPKRQKPGHQLTDEDHAIWRGTAETLKPLKKAKGRVRPSVATPETPQTPAPGRAAAVSQKGGTHTQSIKTTSPPAASANEPPPISGFDKRTERRLARGQSEVEARIDLHGMRQSEAHAALRRFLNDCVGRGLRHVLVITGKGGPSRQRDDDHWSMEETQPGVLRRNVPQWLSEPDLRPIVVSFTPAAIRHGGDGALYVHLRKRDRAR